MKGKKQNESMTKGKEATKLSRGFGVYLMKNQGVDMRASQITSNAACCHCLLAASYCHLKPLFLCVLRL
jgi:hypothetical protein